MSQLFTERYRPKNLDQMILPSRIRTSIGQGELHQNYLFYGSPGLGKCVVKDTMITVLDTRTNKEMKISIEQFIELCQSQ